jgi:hypothetical protein
MFRFAVLALGAAAACGRSRGVQDKDLPGLVVEARKPEAAIDIELAAHDPAELGRALARPYRVVLAALGPHTAGVNSAITVDEAGAQVSELSDHAQIDNGTGGSYHAVYTNSGDYGRETTFIDGKLYLRPRYQRWHARAPESPDEPADLRDRYFEAVAATWELVAPGAELVDRGPIEVAGRRGRKIGIGRAEEPRDPPSEPIAQRKWRQERSIDAIAGEVVLDAERGVPLAVKLSGTVGYSRDGKRFAMKVSVDSAVSGVGTASMIAAPGDADLVATPERRREVDDRDFLLQGIAPPLRRNPDGTAIAPAPRFRDGGAGSGSAATASTKPDAAAKPAAAKAGAKDSAGKPGATKSDAAKPSGGKPDAAKDAAKPSGGKPDAAKDAAKDAKPAKDGAKP